MFAFRLPLKILTPSPGRASLERGDGNEHRFLPHPQPQVRSGNLRTKSQATCGLHGILLYVS